MSRSNPLSLLAVLALFVAGVSALALLKGGLLASRHEGDMLHLLEILFRLERGELPHIDFMTPIGAFAFLPVHAYLAGGLGVDRAFHLAQASVAAGLLPLVWWTAWSRFPGPLAHGFGLLCLVLVLALVHGEAQAVVSVSMHYNRWAWAVSFVAIALAVLKPMSRPRPVLDGALIGFCLAALAMIKVTYLVAFAPGILAALLLRHPRSALVAAALAGLAVAAGVTLWGGVGYWAAYMGDLLAVARSDVRPNPSLPLLDTLVAPAYLGGTLAAAAAFIGLRRAGAEEAGVLVVLLLPGFFYATYQNFGNDPQWLAFLALVVLALRSEAAPDAPVRALTVTAVLLLGLAAPALINLAASPVRHALADPDAHVPMIPGDARHAGFRTAEDRANRTDGVVPLETGQGSERPAPTVFRGETLPDCRVALGLPGLMDAMARDLAEAGLARGQRVFVADLIPSLWLFGGTQPLENGAPWYYGGLPGWESADYLLVPLCVVAQPVRQEVLELIEARGDRLTEVRRTPLYILFSIS